MKVLTKESLRCPVTRKAAFPDKESAERKVMIILKREGYETRVPRRSYRCQHCGWWHLTSSQ